MIVIALCMQNTEIHLRDKYLLIISHVPGTWNMLVSITDQSLFLRSSDCGRWG